MLKHYLIFYLFLSPIFVFSQSFNTAGGLRLGTEIGLTAKQRIANHTALEAILQKGFLKNETALSVLIAQHFPLISRRFNFFLGAGLHKGWIADENILYEDPFGITLIGGIDFTIRNINISWDYKPAINITGGYQNFYSQTGFSLRYVFVKRESKTQKWFEDKKWQFWKKKDSKKK